MEQHEYLLMPIQFLDQQNYILNNPNKYLEKTIIILMDGAFSNWSSFNKSLLFVDQSVPPWCSGKGQ